LSRFQRTEPFISAPADHRNPPFTIGEGGERDPGPRGIVGLKDVFCSSVAAQRIVEKPSAVRVPSDGTVHGRLATGTATDIAGSSELSGNCPRTATAWREF